MTSHPTRALILAALREITPDRLQKAVCGLADGSLTITLTRQTEAEIRGLVKNGDGKEYGVTLTQGSTFCSCKDALYRGVTCKHAVATALYALRQPECAECGTTPAKMNDNAQRPLCRSCWEEREEQACRADRPGVAQDWPAPIHMLSENGRALCGEQAPERSWQPGYWPTELDCWPEACAACERARRRPAVRPDLSLIKVSNGYGQRTAP
jgi:hypothetical protein